MQGGAIILWLQTVRAQHKMLTLSTRLLYSSLLYIFIAEKQCLIYQQIEAPVNIPRSSAIYIYPLLFNPFAKGNIITPLLVMRKNGYLNGRNGVM